MKAVPVRGYAFAAAAASVVLLVALAGRPANAAPGESATPIRNPDLTKSCGIDIELILDESGSVLNFKGNVQSAFRAFTSALNNTGSRLAVSEFSTVARLPLPGAANKAYTTVTDATQRDIFEPYISTNYTPSGSTNWEDAFRVGRYFLPRPNPNKPNLVVFITDGDPNEIIREDQVTYNPGNTNTSQNEYERKVPLADAEVTSAANTAAKDRAVPNANAIKAQGSHILTIAVGNGLNNAQSLARIIDVSGPDVFSGTGTFNIATDDVYRVPNFADLEAAMRQAAFQLCAPSITVRKLLDLTPDPNTPNDRVPGADWDMTATATPTPASWVLPPTGTGNTATATTDASGFAQFQWTTTVPGNSTFQITEEDPAGVPPGFVNDPSATQCTFRTPEHPADQPLPVNATDRGFSATVSDRAIATCQMVNRAPPNPQIQIEKSTNGADADNPPGPFIPVTDANGNPTPITWTYAVTNTGNVTLSGIAVTDDQPGVTVSCPGGNLAPGASKTCTATGTAERGPYANLGSVTATDPFGTDVSDDDPSHYFGAASGIDIEKFTNGLDADNAPGPVVPIGDPITWTYVVTNTGDTPLTGVAVTDDQGVTVTCLQTDLAPAESTTCTAPAATAESGQYENVGTVRATSPTRIVRDSDPSHYFGEDASIDIEKSTNGEDADNAPGPFVTVGDRVTWTYVVTNTGNVPLNWAVNDDQISALACPRIGLISPGQSLTCRASRIAQPGQYENIGSVTGTSSFGTQVTDEDPSHYFGVQGAIDLEKLVNDEDADDPPGPFIPVGGAVTWTYRVTNIGNSRLTGVEVEDLDPGVQVTCPPTVAVLDVNESVDCTATATAQAGAHTDLASVTGQTEAGESVADQDPANYFGAQPGINIEKATNGVDADDAPGPFIPVGSRVDWTYVVTNTGNNTLSSIAVTRRPGRLGELPRRRARLRRVDDLQGHWHGRTGSVREHSARPRAPMGRPRSPTPIPRTTSARTPRYTSRSRPMVRTRTPPRARGSPSATRSPGPTRSPTPATCRSQTSPSPTTMPVSTRRSRAATPMATIALDPSETWTYEATGTANAGQYENTGSVTGTDQLENPLSDTDPSHYFGARAELDIEKSTNGIDADVGPGPQIAVGDPVTWTYVVTNPGNVPIADVSVDDDQAGVNPAFVGGDDELQQPARPRRDLDLRGHRDGDRGPVREPRHRHRHRAAGCQRHRPLPLLRRRLGDRHREVDQRRRRRQPDRAAGRGRRPGHLDLRGHQPRQRADRGRNRDRRPGRRRPGLPGRRHRRRRAARPV